MDASNVVNAFVVSANSYALNQNEDNMKQFQRHFEILVCLTSEETNLTFFQNRSLSSSQCITHIVNVLLDNNVKIPLLTRAFTILHNFSVNSHLLKKLQNTYHVHSAISIFLQRYETNTKDNLFIQCLQLMESVTYNLQIDYLENHFENFICILLKFVLHESSQLLRISLHILSNICRHNGKIQSYICNLPDFKQIFKKLATIINTEVPNIILYALSILSSITPHNTLGAKLWTEEHLLLTFDLIKKLMVSDDICCATAAVNLLIDIIKVPKYQSCLTKLPTLKRCLKKVSKALFDTSPKRSELYLTFLNSLTCVPDIKEMICSFLCSSDESPNLPILKIHPKLVLWCIENNKVPTQVSILSLKLIKTIVTTQIDKDFSCLEENSKEILGRVMETLCSVTNINDSFIEEYIELKYAGFDLLFLLCSKTQLKLFIVSNIDLESLRNLINFILYDCVKENNYNDQIINLFLLIIETIIFLKKDLSHSDQFLQQLFQNEAGMQCLALALTSENKEQIGKSLTLLSSKNCEHSHDVLTDFLLTRNSLKQRKNSLQTYDSVFSSSFSSYPTSSKESVVQSKYSGSAFDSLMNKIENGLQIKDLKSSEIMDMYEHKIAILTLKEQELQSYVEAKTLALQEADRIITQYKCRQSDAETEALRLRSMMKEYECRSEMSASQLMSEELKRKKLESDLNQAYQKIKETEQSASEQRELTQTQVNRLSEQKKHVEEERIKLLEQIAHKDQEKKGFLNQLQQNEEEIKMKNKTIENLQESKDDLIRVFEETKKTAEKSKINFEQKQLQLQNIIEAAQQTISILEEKNENLVNEISKKSEEYSREIADLGNEKEQLSEQLKMKDLKMEDMNNFIKNLNDDLQAKNDIIQENEKNLSSLKLKLGQMESQKTKLKQEKSMLELLCKKYEASIEEKDSQIEKMTHELEVLNKEFKETVSDREGQIQHLKDELEKHKYITEMIHNMTSGKGSSFSKS